MEIFYVPDEFRIEFMKVDIDESDFVLFVLAGKYGAENLYENDKADYLKKEDSIIMLDLENLDVYNAQRIIDFVMGLVYMAEGSFQRMKEKTFIVAPNGYEVCDDVESLFD